MTTMILQEGEDICMVEKDTLQSIKPKIILN